MRFVKEYWIPVLALLVMLIGLGLVINANDTTSKQSAPQTTAQTVTAAPISVVQPQSARDVAASLNCKRFEDHGASQIGGSVDSGACWIGRVKYAINTFPSKTVRDSWLESAEPLGVVPKWETATSVTYKSVD